MVAMQRQPFDNLLRLRDKTLNALHISTQDVNFLSALKRKPLVIFFLDSVVILNPIRHISYMSSHTGVFKAARVLEQTRKHKVALLFFLLALNSLYHFSEKLKLVLCQGIPPTSFLSPGL
jgi:hypothetical protein